MICSYIKRFFSICQFHCPTSTGNKRCAAAFAPHCLLAAPAHASTRWSEGEPGKSVQLRRRLGARICKHLAHLQVDNCTALMRTMRFFGHPQFWQCAHGLTPAGSQLRCLCRIGALCTKGISGTDQAVHTEPGLARAIPAPIVCSNDRIVYRYSAAQKPAASCCIAWPSRSGALR